MNSLTSEQKYSTYSVGNCLIPLSQPMFVSFMYIRMMSQSLPAEVGMSMLRSCLILNYSIIRNANVIDLMLNWQFFSNVGRP